MAQSKATKKFEKNHLKDTLKRRKEGAKVKQKQQIKAKRKARKAKDNQPADELHDGPAQKNGRRQGEENKEVGAMDMDEFFQGGFTILPKPTSRGQRSAKQDGEPAQGRKRKRSNLDEDHNGTTPSPSSQESGSEAESNGADEAHKGQLDALKEKDPEFYKYLQENDGELLDFAGDSAFDEIDGLSGSDAEDGPIEKKRKKQKGESAADSLVERLASAANEVTAALVKKWERAMAEQHSLRSMREVVLAFRAAAHLNEEDGKEYKYSISDPSAYHELLVVALKHIPTVLSHHLPVKETNTGKIRMSTDSKKYRTLAPLLKSHATSLGHVLENLSDAATLRLTLTSLLPIIPYILSFKKLVRDLARTVVSIWSDTSNTEATRIAAFLVIRRLIVIGDPGIREAVLKATYQGLVKGSRSTTVHTIQGVNLMKNSAAELWGLDANIAYTTGFMFIRQLAIHLRSSITDNSKESYKAVYNWQYVHSLDFWSRVLSAHCEALREADIGKESPLRPLIYPLVQITLGTMRLIPTATYFPLRFHLVRSLLRISLATGTYIPLAACLYEVLNSGEMKKPPKPSTLKSLDFPTSIRAAKSYLRTRVYQDGAGEQITELLSEFFVLWAKNIAFPELALPVIVMLKRWLKEASNRSSGNKNAKVNSSISLLVQKLEANSKWVGEERAKVDFAPNDRAGVESFLKDVEWQKSPMGAFVVGQRKMREEKAKLLDESRREEQRNRREEDEKDGVDGVVEQGFDEEGSEEEDDEDVDE